MSRNPPAPPPPPPPAPIVAPEPSPTPITDLLRELEAKINRVPPEQAYELKTQILSLQASKAIELYYEGQYIEAARIRASKEKQLEYELRQEAQRRREQELEEERHANRLREIAAEKAKEKIENDLKCAEACARRLAEGEDPNTLERIYGEQVLALAKSRLATGKPLEAPPEPKKTGPTICAPRELSPAELAQKQKFDAMAGTIAAQRALDAQGTAQAEAESRARAEIARRTRESAEAIRWAHDPRNPINHRI